MEFTMAENLEMGAFLRKDKDGIKKDLEYVYNLFPKLKQRKKQISGTLSGGEQQMLAIGRSIMSKPQLLMMDEPCLGLSPMVKTHLVNSIRDIWKSGITVLLIEQDVSLTFDLAERAYILEHGKVGLEGESRELMNKEEVKRVYFQMG